MNIEHKGMPGHFIGASKCCFHLHTVIDGRWSVSTVGCYHPGDRRDEEARPVGHCRYYETMVFDMDADGGAASRWNELDMEGYNSEADAEEGHRLMVERWAELGRRQRAEVK